jgi:NDP-mannose synthase
VGTFSRVEKVGLGVLQLGDHGRVVDYEEKPTLHVNVSMGIYAMSPRVLVRIPDGHYDMPNLILDLLAAGEPVASWHHDGRWLDIGRPDDYDHANDLFRQFPDTLLPEQRAEGD